jgi:hypothetical protein
MTAKGPQGETIIGQEILICQRRPPLIVSVAQGGQNVVMTQFPPVTKEMYCFDYWPEGEPMVDPELLDLISGQVIDTD